MSKQLTLYRGIYTDENHAEIIRTKGIEEKWYLDHGKLLFKKGEADKFLNKEKLSLGDVASLGNIDGTGQEIQKVLFAAATERDACFYALRNKNEGGYAPSKAVRDAELYQGEMKMYIIKFTAPLDDVRIDGNDFLFPMSYQADKWQGERYNTLCRLLGKSVIDKYLPKLLDKAYDDNALVHLMSSEDEAIMNLYNNKDILINGKRNVRLLSSFKVFSKINGNNILEVREVSEKECENVVHSFRPASQIEIWITR